MLTEEREACLSILNMNPQKGDKLELRLWDGSELEGNFFRYVYKGFVIKNKGEFTKVKCLDVEKVKSLVGSH